jgi:hypothetical protein
VHGASSVGERLESIFGFLAARGLLKHTLNPIEVRLAVLNNIVKVLVFINVLFNRYSLSQIDIFL